MSFCRFSSDDYRCDFYAYESAEGYELYIARNRVLWDPTPSAMTKEALQLPAAEWAELHRAYMDALNAATRENIAHPSAGGHFLFESLQQLRDKIAELSEEGFHAPAWLLPELDLEIRQENEKNLPG